MVFSSLNHLWMMDLPSGKPRRLTNKSDGEFMPSWSPDGKHICYVTWSSDSKGQIYRVNIDGGANPERLTRQSAFYSYPVYSPDSSKIIFLSSSGYDRLHIRFQSVFSEAAAEPADKEPSSMNLAGPDLDLRFIPATGGSSTRIGSVPRLSKSPQFSRALDRVYVTTADGLMSIRLDGYDRRVVLKVTGPNGPSRYHEEEIRLSPDGQRAFLSLLTGNYLVSMPAVGKETVTVNITGGDSTVPVKKLSGEFGNYLSWSPDGNSVIWALGRDVYIKDTATDKTQVIRPSIEGARNHPVGTLVLSGARIVTMKGDEIIESGDIVVTDNRITAVGAKGKVTFPKDGKVIDVSGETITPGFIVL